METIVKRDLVRVLPPEEGKGPREWCKLEVRLEERDGKKRLSICGLAGYVLTPAQARREALQSWEQFFEDSPEELRAMNERCGTHFRSFKSAARYVIENDGEYHGLDAHEHTLNGEDVVLVCTSAGQIREEIARFFPEAAPYFKWHLNDMRPTQDGKSWGYEPLPPEVIAWVENLGKEN